MNVPKLFGWGSKPKPTLLLPDGIHIITISQGVEMSKLLSILAAIEGVTQSVLASKVPVVSSGVGGTILTIALIAEEEVSTFIQSLQAVKGTPSTGTAAPAPAAK